MRPKNAFKVKEGGWGLGLGTMLCALCPACDCLMGKSNPGGEKGGRKRKRGKGERRRKGRKRRKRKRGRRKRRGRKKRGRKRKRKRGRKKRKKRKRRRRKKRQKRRRRWWRYEHVALDPGTLEPQDISARAPGQTLAGTLPSLLRCHLPLSSASLLCFVSPPTRTGTASSQGRGLFVAHF